MDIYQMADSYAYKIINSSDFQRLLELKEIIKKTLGKKIIAFKTAEAKYIEAKAYGKYHPNLKEYQKKFMDAKADLYKEVYVQEYILIEGKIQTKLNQDINELKGSISNKFKQNFF